MILAVPKSIYDTHHLRNILETVGVLAKKIQYSIA